MNEEKQLTPTPLGDIQVQSDRSSSMELSAFTSMRGFELAQRMAKGLMTADLIPQRYQNNIGNTMIAINMAQRLNCDPLMIMQNLYVVHNTPAWSGQFVIAAINQSGMFKGPLRFVEVGERDTMSWGFYAEATSRDDHVVKGPTITLQLAKNEGWIAKNPKWSNMPEMMLRYRAGSWFGRTECPEILMGFQTREEVIDVIDVDPETGEVLGEDRFAKQVPIKAETLKEKAPQKPIEAKAEKKEAPAKSYAEEVEDDDDHPEGEVHPFRDELAKQGWYEDNNRKFNVHGEIWNPDAHATGRGGDPIINSDGHYRVRRGGPLPGAEVEVAENVEPETAAPEGGEAKTPGYEPEPEFIDGPDNEVDTSAYDDWMEGVE